MTRSVRLTLSLQQAETLSRAAAFYEARLRDDDDDPDEDSVLAVARQRLRSAIDKSRRA